MREKDEIQNKKAKKHKKDFQVDYLEKLVDITSNLFLLLCKFCD